MVLIFSMLFVMYFNGADIFAIAFELIFLLEPIWGKVIAHTIDKHIFTDFPLRLCSSVE